MDKDLRIRFSKFTDLPFLVDIYNQAIRSECATGDLNEFSVDDRIDWFYKFDKDKYPLYVAEIGEIIVGYCSISPYRPGREAMNTVAEISYYLDYSFHRKGIATELLKFAISDCQRIRKETLLAILLDINKPSISLLEKFNFKKWGYFPNIINLPNKKCGQVIYGLKIDSQE